MSELAQLCHPPQTYLGLIAMVLIVLGFLLVAVSYLQRTRFPILKSGIALLALAALLIIIYVITPPVFQLLGIKIQDGCPPVPQNPPYCGQDYCAGRANDTEISNCTCLQS